MKAPAAPQPTPFDTLLSSLNGVLPGLIDGKLAILESGFRDNQDNIRESTDIFFGITRDKKTGNISNENLSADAIFFLALQAGVDGNTQAKLYFAKLGIPFTNDLISRFGIELITVGNGQGIVFDPTKVQKLVDENSKNPEFKKHFDDLAANFAAMGGLAEPYLKKKQFKFLAATYTLIQLQERLAKETARLVTLDAELKFAQAKGDPKAVHSLTTHSYIEENQAIFDLEACRRNVAGLTNSIKEVIKPNKTVHDENDLNAVNNISVSDFKTNHSKDRDIIAKKHFDNSLEIVAPPVKKIFQGILFTQNSAKDSANYKEFQSGTLAAQKSIENKLLKYPELKAMLESMIDKADSDSGLTDAEKTARKEIFLEGYEKKLNEGNDAEKKKIEEELIKLNKKCLDCINKTQSINEELQLKLLIHAILIASPLVGIDIIPHLIDALDLDSLQDFLSQISFGIMDPLDNALSSPLSILNTVFAPLGAVLQGINGFPTSIMAILAFEALAGNPLGNKVENLRKESTDFASNTAARKKTMAKLEEELDSNNKKLLKQCRKDVLAEQKKLFIATKAGEALTKLHGEDPANCEKLIEHLFKDKAPEKIIEILGSKGDVGMALYELKNPDALESLLKLAEADTIGVVAEVCAAPDIVAAITNKTAAITTDVLKNLGGEFYIESANKLHDQTLKLYEQNETEENKAKIAEEFVKKFWVGEFYEDVKDVKQAAAIPTPAPAAPAPAAPTPTTPIAPAPIATPKHDTEEKDPEEDLRDRMAKMGSKKKIPETLRSLVEEFKLKLPGFTYQEEEKGGSTHIASRFKTPSPNPEPTWMKPFKDYLKSDKSVKPAPAKIWTKVDTSRSG